MSIRILVFFCLLISFITSSSPTALAAQRQYKVHFNNIICLNPWNNIINDNWLALAYPINAEFMNADMSKSSTLTPLKYDGASLTNFDLVKNFAQDGKSETKYFSDMSFNKFPNKLLDPERFRNRSERGSPKSFHNDRFYITFKNAPRDGMILPVIGGDKDMYRYAYWSPTAAEGNPSLANQDTITYYLWEANTFSPDRPVGNFSVKLKVKKDKGPQLVEIAHGYYSNGKWLSAAYVIEYEVK